MTKRTKAGSDTIRDASDQGSKLARLALNPPVHAALSIKAILALSDALDLPTLIHELSSRAKECHDGDLKSGEAMLTSQAHCLDAIFNRLVSMGAANLGSHLNAADTYLRLALKAQGQCRSTIEALAEIKNPTPVAFVKQANISAGPQQVNNGAQSQGSLPRAEKTFIEPTRLLEANDGERLDTGTAGAAAGVDSALETVGTVNRAANRRRES